MATENLAAILSGCSTVFFDFDGPICDVFAGMPANQVATELANLVEKHHPALTEKARGTDDPMEILRLSPQGGEALIAAVEEALTKAEVAAVAVAGNPTDGAVAALEATRKSGRSAVIVSNNSAECVREFMRRHEIHYLVQEVVGRAHEKPELMKPSPHSLFVAAELVSEEPSRCALVGDSVTDVEAAHRAGSRAIGYANKPPKLRSLAEAGADEVVTDMLTVARALAS
ncbi:HAD family hydrolase [Streptomyces sp. Mo3]|uniref:HAD family hydrolase n=1 Tax=Streptomyces sp. Mo3 TaxID=3161190 RepID=UPI0039F06518